MLALVLSKVWDPVLCGGFENDNLVLVGGTRRFGSAQQVYFNCLYCLFA